MNERLNLPITGICTFGKFPMQSLDALDARFALLGIPCDIGVGYLSGTRFGPRRVREASVQYGRGDAGFYDPERGEIYLQNPRAVDAGDADIVTGDLEHSFENIETAVRGILRAKAIPVSIGGDHSVLIPIGRALSELNQKVDVIQFDAHLDWSKGPGPQRFSNGCPMRRLSEMPYVNSMTQIGLRGLGSSAQADFADARAWGSRLITAREALKIGAKAVVDRIPPSNCCYVSIDIDSFDMSVASGTGSPMPGGFDYNFVQDVLEGIAAKCRVIGFDLVEVAPQYDPAGSTCRIAAMTILSFMGFIQKSLEKSSGESA